jgi:hypothetical protein
MSTTDDYQRVQALIAEWARSPSEAKRVAATLALEMSGQPKGTRVESCRETAERCNVKLSTVENARIFLAMTNIIRKSNDRHYYVA